MNKYYELNNDIETNLIKEDNKDIQNIYIENKNIFDVKFDYIKMNEKFNIKLNWYDIYERSNISLNRYISILNLLDIELYEILYNFSNKIIINELFLIDFFINEYHKKRIINKLQIKYNINNVFNKISNNKIILILYVDNNTLIKDILKLYKILNIYIDNIYILGKDDILIDKYIYFKNQMKTDVININNYDDIYKYIILIKNKYKKHILYIDCSKINNSFYKYIDILLNKDDKKNYIITEYNNKNYDKRIIFLSSYNNISNNESYKLQLNKLIENNRDHIIYLFDICKNYKYIIDIIDEKIIDNIYIKNDNNYINDDIKNNKKIRLCILCHIGNIKIFKSMILYLLKLEEIEIEIEINLYFNIIKNMINKDEIILLIDRYFNKKLYKNIKIFESENKGFDIGGYFNILNNIDDYNNDIYILCHTKTDNIWRNNMLDSIFNNINYNIDLMKNNDNIGIIGSKHHTYYTNFEINRTNYNHLNDLTEIFDIKKLNNFYFIGGTCMMLKRDIIDIYIKNDINKLYNMLNDDNTFDYNWYININVHPDIYYDILIKNIKINKNNIIKYYKNNNNNKYSSNLLHAIINNKQDKKFRDGMIEHAFERLFGLLCQENNLLLITI